METKDHLALGYHLLRGTENSFSPMQERLFLLGSIMPDIWVLSYMNGIIERHNFYGHVYSNAKKRVEKHCVYLMKRKKNKLRSSFVLGVLMHYLADSFTYPHNDKYSYGMSEHKKYEHELHHILWRELVFGKEKHQKKKYRCEMNLVIKNLYSDYKTVVHTPKSDCRYIMDAAGSVFESGIYYLAK